MRFSRLRLSFAPLLAVQLSPLIHASTPPADPDGSAMIQVAQRLIAEYHAGEKPSGAVLRVVYFHPSDRDPLPNYAERLDRVMNDISDFYRDGLRRFGLECNGLALEKKDDRLVLHIVKGKSPASAYQHESGDQTVAEIRAALAGTIDIDREHVLVLYGLCRKEPDGRYVFDAPYYGKGSAQGGICHAADCELLDPALLKETSKNIVYTEHYYPRLEQTVAKFNSMYLGGTAHELGHGLGLPHDAGNPVEKPFGTSLMGMGNLTYRQERWGGGAPVILTRASALQLASHPLITGSNRGRWDPVDSSVDALTFSVESRDLKIQGKASGRIPPYGVIAYAWPVGQKTDHGARTFPAALDNGNFTLTLSGLRPDTYHLKIATLYVNGGTAARELRFGFNGAGKPDVAELNGSSFVNRAETALMKGDANARAFLTDEAIAAAPTPEAQRKMRILRAVLDPAPLVDLSTTKENAVYLSDANWTEAEVGWGQLARNYYWFDQRIQKGVFLSLRGQVFEKGLYAHSRSRFVFPTGAKWKRFTATIGLRDGALDQGSAIFTIRGDGKDLYRSPILRPGSREEMKVDISGINQLELLADGGEGHTHNSWAIWADPKVSR
jgi:hypothetical protein